MTQFVGFRRHFAIWQQVRGYPPSLVRSSWFHSTTFELSAHQMPGVDGHSIQSILSISDRALLRRFSSPEHVDRYSGALKGDGGSVMVQNEPWWVDAR